MVIDSNWSCVTQMQATPERRRSSAISARACDAQIGIEVAERLVHQEDARVAHHGAGERNALALTDRELIELGQRKR